MLTAARQRMVNGETRWSKPSRFINEIPPELLDTDKLQPVLGKESRMTLTSQDFHGTRTLKAVSAGLEWDIMPMLLKQHHQRKQ